MHIVTHSMQSIYGIRVRPLFGAPPPIFLPQLTLRPASVCAGPNAHLPLHLH